MNMRIGVSRSDTRIEIEERSVTYRHKRKKDNEYTQSNELNSQMSMVLRLESSCVNLTVIVTDIVLAVATC